LTTINMNDNRNKYLKDFYRHIYAGGIQHWKVFLFAGIVCF
jgi:hypothetical protein